MFVQVIRSSISLAVKCGSVARVAQMMVSPIGGFRDERVGVNGAWEVNVMREAALDKPKGRQPVIQLLDHLF